jgi:hypothetical protein
MNPESVDVTAGLGGFLAFFLLAAALYFLMRNMNARLRRLGYREEQEAKEATEPREPREPREPEEPTAGSPGDKPGSAGPKGGSQGGPDLV